MSTKFDEYLATFSALLILLSMLSLYILFMYPVVVSILLMLLFFFRENFGFRAALVPLLVIPSGVVIELLFLKAGIFITACVLASIVYFERIARIKVVYKRVISAFVVLLGAYGSIALAALQEDHSQGYDQTTYNSSFIEIIEFLFTFPLAALITGYSVPMRSLGRLFR